MKFSKEFLLEELEEDPVLEEIFDKRRWSIVYRRVFKFEGRFYETMYSIGATESQDEHPYEYDPDEIECKEVYPIPTITYK